MTRQKGILISVAVISILSLGVELYIFNTPPHRPGERIAITEEVNGVLRVTGYIEPNPVKDAIDHVAAYIVLISFALCPFLTIAFFICLLIYLHNKSDRWKQITIILGLIMIPVLFGFFAVLDTFQGMAQGIAHGHG